mmetsp:Transcript_26954/g.53770  ORF Transcript_26954/g.53770 Transcript_26954/m.53770 type:complete len:229 (+) Transcript_26954:1006-1692(+)
MAYAKTFPCGLKAPHVTQSWTGGNTFRRCLESLSQKLTTPSPPTVANVPKGWKTMPFTAWTRLSVLVALSCLWHLKAKFSAIPAFCVKKWMAVRPSMLPTAKPEQSGNTDTQRLWYLRGESMIICCLGWPFVEKAAIFLPARATTRTSPCRSMSYTLSGSWNCPAGVGLLQSQNFSIPSQPPLTTRLLDCTKCTAFTGAECSPTLVGVEVPDAMSHIFTAFEHPPKNT